MQPIQNVTNPNTANSGGVVDDVTLTPQQDYYITFVAANGLSVKEDGSFEQMTASKFAEKIGVSRMTLYRWQDSIVNFQHLVRQRRQEIFTLNRENMIWRGLFLQAAKGNPKAAEMILSHFGDYTPPTQKHEVKIGGLADLVKLARQKHTSKGVIDATPNQQ